MNSQVKINEYKTIEKVAERIRDDLNSSNFVLIFAHNGTGKTRLSMGFKDCAQKKGAKDTLYFNAFTEDLFSWENDLESDTERNLLINSKSIFFEGFKDLSLEVKISEFLSRYADFDFRIDYENWKVVFSREISNPHYREGSPHPKNIIEENIKISRGEENIFIWCIFLAFCQLVIDDHDSYKWVKNFYIDDPISSLDDSNAIAVAHDLANLLKLTKKKIKAVISSHHALFFNVIYNELRNSGIKSYFYNRPKKLDIYTLSTTEETPFFHHVSMLSEMKKAIDDNKLYTYHFNIMRTILEKTSTFFGFKDFSACIKDLKDEALFARAVNLLSHGSYSIYEPKEMGEDNKILFKRIFTDFIEKYKFELPQIIKEQREE